jgi:acetylornithine deacetylase
LNPIKFNPGIIRGGEWASSTPSWCDVDCRFGLLPDASVDGLKRQIVETLDAAVRDDPFLTRNQPKIVWNGFQAEGAVLLPGSPAEDILAECHHQIFGTSLRRTLSNAVNDTRFYNRDFQIPGLCYGPAGQGLHGVNERANLPSLMKTTLVIALFIAKWCGVKS